uniref:Uncharacterized protein LOC105033788 n=1 Tax=Elaeis guineensis var. tenera TaxID=51953 RepID=A0A6I9QCM0_ELAGV|nr:uncharacterized protein LOC105033788 [Elaeis guineensis]
MHTCSSGVGRARHPKASKIWVADIVLQKVRDRPLYRLIDIKKDIKKDFDIHLPYGQAWLVKEVARFALHGEDYASFDLLQWYGEIVAETNPEGLFVLEYPDRHFERMFICFHACLVGFKSGCRSLLFIDGTHILNRYGGVMLSAVVLNAENGMFLLAFAIVDRAKGLTKGVRTSFPNATNGYCLRYLKENFKKKLDGLSAAQKEKMLSLLDSAAYALQISQFIGYISDIREISSKACEWIECGSDIDH